MTFIFTKFYRSIVYISGGKKGTLGVNYRRM